MLLLKVIYQIQQAQVVLIHKVMPILYKQTIASGYGTVLHGLTVVQFKVIKVKRVILVAKVFKVLKVILD
jgi:hypothetical protein